MKFTFAGPDFAVRRAFLNKATIRSVRGGNTEGTWNNKNVHVAAYYRFCDSFGYQYFPASDWRYCQFAQYLMWEGKAPGTIDNYVSTIRTMHRLIGLKAPVRDKFIIQ